MERENCRSFSLSRDDVDVHTTNGEWARMLPLITSLINENNSQIEKDN